MEPPSHKNAQFPWPVFPRTMYTNLNFGIIGNLYNPWPPWPNHIMETILIIYQQYTAHFHLKQDSDLKIPLNGLKMNQLDQIWFQIKRKIPFKLTCCEIFKIAADVILKLLPLTSPKSNYAGRKRPIRCFSKQHILTKSGFIWSLDQVCQMCCFLWVWANQG